MDLSLAERSFVQMTQPFQQGQTNLSPTQNPSSPGVGAADTRLQAGVSLPESKKPGHQNPQWPESHQPAGGQEGSGQF
jgi:hypothetical protein